MNFYNCKVFNNEEIKNINREDKNIKNIGNLNLVYDKVYRYLLDNGIRVIFIPMESNLFAAGVFIGAGSRHEVKSYGIAHFLEHMIFKGTKTKTSDEVNEILDNIGAVSNASTSYEYTSYYLSGNPHDAENLVDILIDLYSNPIFPEEDIENEKKVVLEELRMGKDNHKRELFDKLKEKMLENVNYNIRRPIIGYEDTISKLTRKDIIDFRKNYKFDNTVIVISGNYKKDIIMNILKNHFNKKLILTDIPDYNKNIEQKFIIPYDNINNNKIKKSDNNIKKSDDNINKIKFHLVKKNNINKSNIIFINKIINQSIVILSFRAPSYYSKYHSSISLLSDILTSGFSSRLFNLLRNKLAVSYYSNAYIYSLSDCGFFNITVGLDPDVVNNTIKEILLELKNIIINGLTEKEFNIAKKKSETLLLFDFKEPLQYVNYYGLLELMELPYQNIVDIYEDIHNINMKDVVKSAKLIFKKNNFFVGIVGNVDKTNINELENIINDKELYFS